MTLPIIRIRLHFSEEGALAFSAVILVPIAGLLFPLLLAGLESNFAETIGSAEYLIYWTVGVGALAAIANQEADESSKRYSLIFATILLGTAIGSLFAGSWYLLAVSLTRLSGFVVIISHPRIPGSWFLNYLRELYPRNSGEPAVD